MFPETVLFFGKCRFIFVDILPGALYTQSISQIKRRIVMNIYDVLLNYRRMRAEKYRLEAYLRNLQTPVIIKRNRNGKMEYSIRETDSKIIHEKLIDEKTYQAFYTNKREKKIYTKRLNDLNSEIEKIKRRLPEYEAEIIQLYKDLSKIDPQPKFLTTYMPEDLTIQTMRGDLVRAKGEGFIADALYINKIHYEYEIILPVSNSRCDSCHPDFYIKDNIRGIPIIWEHFGYMNKTDYVETFINKLETYKKLGFVPGYNLIITFECYDSEHKDRSIYMDSYLANRIVREWFLPEGILPSKGGM